VIEIDESVGRPDLLPQIFARNHAAGVFQQNGEHLKGLLLQAQASAVLAEFSSRQVHFEDGKTQKPRFAAGWWRRHDFAPVSVHRWNKDFRRCRLARDRTGRRYNIGVATPAPKPVSEDRHRHHVYAAEATGLLLIGIVLLILMIVRYWSYINWSMR